MSTIHIGLETAVRAELFNERHLFDAERMAGALDVSIATVAAAIGKRVQRRKSAESLQDGLGRLGVVYSDLIELFADDRDAVLRWFNTPNRALEGRARPKTLLEHGDLEVLEALVDAMKRRQPL